MSAAIIPLPHPAALNHLRAAVDVRARTLGSTAAARARAKRQAARAVLDGASPAWAYTQACRDLRGAAPASRDGGAS